jgi:hypothetical protein
MADHCELWWGATHAKPPVSPGARGFTPLYKGTRLNRAPSQGDRVCGPPLYRDTETGLNYTCQ